MGASLGNGGHLSCALTRAPAVGSRGLRGSRKLATRLALPQGQLAWRRQPAGRAL